MFGSTNRTRSTKGLAQKLDEEMATWPEAARLEIERQQEEEIALWTGIARRLEVKVAWLGWSDVDFRRQASQTKARSHAWLMELARVIVRRLPRFVRRSGAAGTMNVLTDDRDKTIAKCVDLYLTDPRVDESKRTMNWAVHETGKGLGKAFPGVSSKTIRNAHKRFGRIEHRP
jgi:hypothetical protein